jgi:catechol 2,3-dioxygenase-like lactoylglutathione lyase family enzyme
MTEDRGSPPRTGWAKLVPELLVSDIASSTAFWRDRLGFAIAYQRPEQSFVYLERPAPIFCLVALRAAWSWLKQTI